MFGQTASGSSNTSAGARFFRYEVTGLRQSDATDNKEYSIRKSGSTFLTVPYNRMTEEMQRLSRLGAKIVSIKPLVGPEA